MTTEMMSRNQREAVIIEAGYFYAISKEGNVVRFKPGRKKKEAPTPVVLSQAAVGVPSQAAVDAVVAGEPQQ